MRYKYANLKKIICLFIVLCIGFWAGIMTGCAENYEFDDMSGNYSVVYENVSYDWSAEHLDFVAGCDSLAELKAVCKKSNYSVYNKNSNDYESDFGKKIREYTKGYFKSRSLVVCAFSEPHYFGMRKVEDLEVNENTLTLKIKFQGTSDAADEVMVVWGFVIEVDKNFVSSVTDYKYIII